MTFIDLSPTGRENEPSIWVIIVHYYLPVQISCRVSHGNTLFDRQYVCRIPAVSARRNDRVFILFMSENLGAERFENVFYRGP